MHPFPHSKTQKKETSILGPTPSENSATSSNQENTLNSEHRHVQPSMPIRDSREPSYANVVKVGGYTPVLNSISSHRDDSTQDPENFYESPQPTDKASNTSTEELLDVLFSKINANKALESKKETPLNFSPNDTLLVVKKTETDASIDHSKTQSSNSSDTEASNKLNKMTTEQTHIDPNASIESISMIKE